MVPEIVPFFVSKFRVFAMSNDSNWILPLFTSIARESFIERGDKITSSLVVFIVKEDNLSSGI